MPRHIIVTPNAPSSPLYSQGVKAGSQLFVSGTTGIDPHTGALAGSTIQDQTRQALANCRAVLEAGGASLDDVVEVGVLLTDPRDFDGMNEEYGRWFPEDPPTASGQARCRDIRAARLNTYDSGHRLILKSN